MASPSRYKSAYVPSVQFQDGIDTAAVDPYIEKKLRKFFRAQEDTGNLDELQRIAPEEAITDIEWKDHEVEFKYIYEVVMAEARKVDGRIDHTAYTLTFDHELTPDQCGDTGIYYGCMTLAGEPVLYYVRLDLARLIAEARKHAR